MSYALRNTLYLGVTLALMIASGWGFIYIMQSQKIDELHTIYSERQSELEAYKATSQNYSEILEGYMRAMYKVENHKKELMPDHRVPPVYDYVRTINQGTATTEVNFVWRDSVTQTNYGVNRFTVSGSGQYRNFYNFIQRIERSKPLYKITSLQIQTVNAEGRLNEVNFEFNVDSYYSRQENMYHSSQQINRTSLGITHNPFFPLIHNVPANVDNLLNVDDSRLIALTSDRAYIINQQGALDVLSVGDAVYLGTLQSIDETSATFFLNRGGIPDQVTMNIKSRL